MVTQKLIFIIFLFRYAESWNKGPKWDFCECEWYPWLEWSRCTQTCGGGQQYRQRWIGYKTHEACTSFSDCADTGTETRDCGQTCLNGGTFMSYNCFCPIGYTGECCEKGVFCHKPSSIANGRIEGSDHGYRSSITYVCNDGYSYGNHSWQTSLSRYCNSDGKWTNEQPQCQYIRSCSSNPCMNKAKCIDIPGTYKCECLTGWTGRNCETDTQAPEILGCPHHATVIADKNVTYFRWKAPRIYDPHGFKVDVTVKKLSETFITKWVENITAPEVDLPWGVHRIEYSAVKPTNGMTATCNFSITAQPVPCKGLPVSDLPLLCNGWFTTFRHLCKPLCMPGYRPLNGDAFKNAWYECLSDGKWNVPKFYSKCIPDKRWMPMIGKSLPVLQTGCSDDKNIFNARLYYVKELRMSPVYSELCQMKDCKPNNVELHC